ncbi:MAG: radical SAM protein [Candidatus Aminicenantes bacterium]|nr:radical SAM protein [Candidatus Aminicenantes bacterium]
MREILDRIRLRPLYCVWEITSQCNMRCLHCASNLGESDRPRGEELSSSECLRVCRELAELGCGKLVLSGGEAVLRPDWEDIAREAIRLGMFVSLITNGFLIDKALARRMREAGLCRVAISLDGLEPTHNRMRRNPRSFERAMDAIAFLREEGLPVNAVTHANRDNLAELPALEKLLAEAGIDVWRIQFGVPLGRMRKYPELVLRPEDLPALADFLVAAKKRSLVTISVGDNIGYFSHHEPELRAARESGKLPFWSGCYAGCLSVGIESNGNVKGCLSLQSDEFVEGNVKRNPLREIWERPGAFAYTRGFEVKSLAGACEGCEYGEVCRGGCTFLAFATSGRCHDNPYCLHRICGTSPALRAALEGTGSA